MTVLLLQMEPLKQKLNNLKFGSVLITKEERDRTEKVCHTATTMSKQVQIEITSCHAYADLPEVHGCLDPA